MAAFARDIRTAPNLITLSRVGLVLAAAPIYLRWSPGLGMALAAVAGLTDYADGIVARRTGQVTRLGEILDQFSDLVFESLLLMVVVWRGFLPPVILLLYLLREFWILCIRRFVAGIGQNIPSSIFGKLKSNFLNWAFLPLFLHISGWLPVLEPFMGWLGYLGVGLALVSSYLSAAAYTAAFVRAYDNRSSTTRPQNAGTG
jgi:cardiolipin synthase